LGSIIVHTLTGADTTGNVEASLVVERMFSQEASCSVIAHRGASALEAENTLPAFEAAIDAGADAVELDVRTTADGIVVVMHDADVSRTTDGKGLVHDLRLEELKRLRIRTAAGDETEVPTLEEVLACVTGRAGVDIELKNIPGEPDFDPNAESLVEATVSVVHRAGFIGTVLLSSFNPFSLVRVREIAPDISTGLLCDPSVTAHAALGFSREQGHDWVLPFVGRLREAGDGFVADVHDSGLLVGTWVVDDPDIAVSLMRAAVDAIATNEPAALVTARAEAFR
jgi:glycerophosphoryl diester phosphodiesterase